MATKSRRGKESGARSFAVMSLPDTWSPEGVRYTGFNTVLLAMLGCPQRGRWKGSGETCWLRRVTSANSGRFLFEKLKICQFDSH